MQQSIFLSPSGAGLAGSVTVLIWREPRTGIWKHADISTGRMQIYCSDRDGDNFFLCNTQVTSTDLLPSRSVGSVSHPCPRF